jgi:CRP/FNR family transcriptional regulator, cyclic AMP receptor protein
MLRMVPKRSRAFSVKAFLESGGVARRVVEFCRREVVFAQGDQASAVMYIQRGGIKLSVVSQTGKEAVVAFLGPGDFFGEGCLAGQRRRIGSATAITPSTVLIVRKRDMLRKLHERPELSDHFISNARKVLYEQVPQTGLYRGQRRPADQQLASNCGPPRLSVA